jgi:5-methylcytosine-specific restriction endonuclease McrA
MLDHLLAPMRGSIVSPNPSSVRTLSDEDLLRALRALSVRASDVEADLLAHLGEVDSRELYLGQGYASMFAYCTEALHFSEGSAYHRITAARAARAYPVLLERVRSGELHLAAVRLLAPHLSAGNHVELIEQAKHRSKRAIEEMLADRAPKPDALPLVRRVPVPRSDPERFADVHPSAPHEPAASAAATPPRPELPRSAPHPEPLGTGRYRVQFTAGPETHAKLREARALLRHRIPDGDLAAIFDHALSALLREVRRDRFAETDRPRKRAETRPADQRPSRHVPAAVRREVVRRDEARCTFVSPSGHRCASRDALEFHHTEPFARRPEHSIDGMTLRCRAHNRLAAIQDFGREHMSRFRPTRPGTSSPDDDCARGSRARGC